MANVLNRTTFEYKRSVNTPDYPTAQWIINPDMSPVAGVPQRYWKIVGDLVQEMTQPEKDVVDATLLPEDKLAKARTFDLHTQQIIAEGTEVPPASGHFYAIDASAMMALKAQRDVGTFPFLVHSIGFTAVYTVPDVATADNVLSQMRSRLRTVLQEGATLLEQIRNAADKAALDAIVDPR